MKKILAQWPFYLPLLGILFGFSLANHIQTQALFLFVFLFLIGCILIVRFLPNWKFAYFVFLIFVPSRFFSEKR
jgi:hypothetical protein